MKTFKSYLAEDVKWQRSISTLIFDVAGADHVGFEAFWMPLSSSITKRIWPKQLRATAFHVTNDEGYEKIKKLQGKKKSISTFFDMSGDYMEKGVGTSGGVIIELDANVLGAFTQDVMSAPDKTGRRFVQLQFWKDGDLKKYSKGIKNLVENILNKYWKKVMNVSTIPSFNRGNIFIHWMQLGQNARNDKKTLSLIIKDYMDGIEKIYKQNAKDFTEIMTDYLKSRRTRETWDEVIANDFKIKKVFIIPYSRTWGDTFTQTSAELARMVGKDPKEAGYDDSEIKSKMEEFIEKVKSDGFPVVEANSLDMETYTRKIATKESGQ